MVRQVLRTVLVAQLCAIAAHAPAQECGPLKIVAQVRLWAAPDERAVFAPVRLQNQTKYMLLDTGGILDQLTPATVAALGLETHRTPNVRFYDVKGNYTDHATVVPDFAIGNLTAHNAEFVVGSNDLFGSSPFIAGILGPGLLRNYDVAVDFGAKTLTLLSQDHCEGRVIYWPASTVAVVPMQVDKATGHISVPVKLDGQTLTALVDTGAQNSVLNLSVAEGNFALKPADMTVFRHLGDRDNSVVYSHTFRSLSFEGLSVANPTFDIIPDLAGRRMPQGPQLGTRISDSGAEQGLPDMLIGMDVLRHLHIYIAYKEQKLYITPASTPAVTAGSMPTQASPVNRPTTRPPG